MSRAITTFSKNVKELRLLLCQSSPESKGVRDFIEKQYTNIKKCNPELPILVRECSGIQPKLWARFGKGKETCFDLSNKGEAEIYAALEKISQTR